MATRPAAAAAAMALTILLAVMLPGAGSLRRKLEPRAIRNTTWSHPFRDDHLSAQPRRSDSIIPDFYFNAPKNCNRHPYQLLINNPTICRRHHSVFLLFLVRTHIANSERRKAIRETWGASYNLPRLVMPLVFILGRGEDLRDTLQEERLITENHIYRDIIQEDFLDTYWNSSLKTMAAYKWVHNYCPNAQFVLMANDDVVVDIFKLVPYLQTFPHRGLRTVPLCYLYPCCMLAERQPPHTSPSGWYRGHAYPAYCSTSAYIAPANLIQDLYLMSKDTPAFMPEEPYIGVLAEKLGITFQDTYKSYAGMDGPLSLMNQFNDTGYLQLPTMVGVVAGNFPKREVEMIRYLWQHVMTHHKHRPTLDVQIFMGTKQTEGDSHVYRVAVAALILDLVVMLMIGYLIFCSRRGRR